jgi:hypothetical protein
VIESQTLSVFGAVATLTNHQVISLASEGIVVQIQGGQVSTITLPKTTTVPSVATIAGNVVSITGVAVTDAKASEKNVVVVVGQTLSIGGEVETIEGHQVVSLGSEGVVVQIPGGEVTTIAVPYAASKISTFVSVASIVEVTMSISALAAQAVTTALTANIGEEGEHNNDDDDDDDDEEEEGNERNPPRPAPAPAPPVATTRGVGEIVQSFYEGQAVRIRNVHLEWWIAVFFAAMWIMAV